MLDMTNKAVSKWEMGRRRHGNPVVLRIRTENILMQSNVAVFRFYSVRDGKMIILKGRYWLEICNEKYYNPKECFQNEIDGFWIAFLYRNIQNANNDIENIVKKLVLSESFKAAKISLPYFDRLIVFTSCDQL